MGLMIFISCGGFSGLVSLTPTQWWLLPQKPSLERWVQFNPEIGSYQVECLEKVIYLRFRTTDLSLEAGSHELMNNFASLVLVSDTSTMETKLSVYVILSTAISDEDLWSFTREVVYISPPGFFFFFFCMCVCDIVCVNDVSVFKMKYLWRRLVKHKVGLSSPFLIFFFPYLFPSSFFPLPPVK